MVENISIKQQTIRIHDISVKLEIVNDTDAIIDYYAASHPDDVDMIPYYAELWPSALALAKHLLSKAVSFSGKSVIELGCGLGLPSFVLAKKGAGVVASDFHPHNEMFFKRNASLNNLTTITYQAFHLASPPRDSTYDMVIGSDLLYDEHNIETMVACAGCLCAQNGMIIIADPGRRNLQRAVTLFKDRGYEDSLFAVDDMFIIELAKKSLHTVAQAL